MSNNLDHLKRIGTFCEKCRHVMCICKQHVDSPVPVSPDMPSDEEIVKKADGWSPNEHERLGYTFGAMWMRDRCLATLKGKEDELTKLRELFASVSHDKSTLQCKLMELKSSKSSEAVEFAEWFGSEGYEWNKKDGYWSHWDNLGEYTTSQLFSEFTAWREKKG